MRKISSNANVRKFFSRFLRFGVPPAAILYLMISLQKLPAEVFMLWKDNTSAAFLPLLILFILAFCNWSLEALKWKMLCAKLEPVNFVKAFWGVLYGVTLGMITPKRSGEFLGRSLVLSPWLRSRGMLINLTGSLMQLLVTLIAGGVSLFVVMQSGSPVDFSLRNPALLVPLLVLVVPALAFAGKRPLLRQLSLHPLGENFLQHLMVFGSIASREMLLLLGWSMGRYLIFFIQFLILLHLFGTPLTAGLAFLILSLTYLFLSPVPVSSLVEAGVRGSMILLVFDLFFSQRADLPPGLEISLVASMLGLWLFNLAIPALAGALFALGGKVSSPQKSS